MKKKNVLSIVWSFVFVFMALGATFSFFSASAKSADAAVNGKAAQIGIDLSVTSIYSGHQLVPMDDADLDKAYAQECIDDVGYGACHAYNIHMHNTGGRFNYVGTIRFDINHIYNLKYKLLNSDGTTYVSDAEVYNDYPLSLGDMFYLDDDESKDFILLIWLSNKDYIQDEEDLSGSYNAAVTYESLTGNMITGSFSG